MAVLLCQLEHLVLLQHPFLLISLLSIAAATLMFLISLLVRRDKLSNEIPPSPRKFPLLGNLHQLGCLPHRSLRDLANKHGPLMLLHMGSFPTLVVSSAELARDIMMTHGIACASRPPSIMADKLLYGSRDVASSPYGEYWRQAREVCVLHLLSLKRVRMFSPVREQEIAHMLRKIHASSMNGASLNLSEIIFATINNIICRVTFGRTYWEKKGSDQIKRVLGDFMTLLFGEFPVGNYIPWLAWVDRLSGLTKRAEKNFKELDAFLEEVIQHYYRSKRSGDDPTKEKQESFMEVLLSLDETEGTRVTLSRENIKAILLDMLGGGSDTTCAAIEWTMAELVRHPETMKRVQKEVRGIVGIKANIKDEDLECMKYLKAVIKESLRLHPPGPLLPRQSTKQIKLQGYNIPAMTTIVVNAFAIGTDPNVWQRPDEFWPDRFLHDANIDYKDRDFKFIPFGSERRGCPGILFAIPTIEHAVANLLYHFDWEMPGARSFEQLDVSESFGLTVHLKSSLVLVAKSLSS